MSTTSLPLAPAAIVDATGQPCFGKFCGAPADINWSGLKAPYRRNPWWQQVHHKRWQYLALASDDLFCGIAIVDVGWTNTAFAYVFDRQQKQIIASYSQDGVPGLTSRLNSKPATGAASHFQFLHNRIDFCHAEDASFATLDVVCGDFSIQAQLEVQKALPSLSAVGTVFDGTVHATVKSGGMPVTGDVVVAGVHFVLDGGIASMDHSNGFLARETAWRWASAHNLEMGFNLQSGYFGDQENALWIDGKIISLGAACFEFNPDNPLASWHISTDDGLLDVVFQPEGCRQEDKNLVIAASRYVQPIGTFSGWVKADKNAEPRAFSNLAGVTEDHFSRW